MLLDRRRIRKWAKWVALLLAIIFALGFLVGGIGYGTGGFSLLDAFSGGCGTDTTEPDGTQTELDKYLAALQTNPADTDAMRGAARVYMDLYRASDGQNTGYLSLAAGYLEQAIAADPSLKDVYLQLADVYKEIGSSAALQAEVEVLEKATAVDPNNPEIYLMLGTAQRSLGNIGAAVLAWQKYLQLDPNGQYADTIRQQLDLLTGANTTTTAGTAATTVPGAATTTTLPAGTTTTSAATTSTTG